MADDVLYAPEKLVEAVDGLVAGGNTMPPRDPNDDDDDAEDEDDDADRTRSRQSSENPTNSAKPGRTPMSRKPRHGDRAVVTGHNYVDRVRRADVVARPKIGRRTRKGRPSFHERPC